MIPDVGWLQWNLKMQIGSNLRYSKYGIQIPFWLNNGRNGVLCIRPRFVSQEGYGWYNAKDSYEFTM